MRKAMWKRVFGFVSALFVLAGTALGNGITVTNVSLQLGAPAGCVDVQFDLAWSNSWRATWTEMSVNPAVTTTNWDAAWVFIKWRPNASYWGPATLSTNSQPTAPAGEQVNVTTDGVGAFIHLSTNSCGAFKYTAKLRWNYTANGAPATSNIDVSVQAIEMVYVPQGAFYVGDGQSPNGEGQLYQGGGGTLPYPITSEAAIPTSNQVNCLWGASTSGNTSMGGNGWIPAAFPKGYNAFYCMKYEITQGEYTDFLNKLANTQAVTRLIGNQGSNRQTIGGNWPNYTNAAPDRACNWLSWSDGAAYAAWAGLRPMTELEFEKACRGVAAPVAGEYAWGNATLTNLTGFVGTDGSGTETASPATANCLVTGGIQGPCRVGIFATAGSSRQSAGASYWGIMELSGDLWERCVSIGLVPGRAFTGSNGSGVLNGSGQATNTDWYTDGTGGDATGAGFRGGSWVNVTTITRVSDRANAAFVVATRYYDYGWRAVRVAP